MFRLSPTANAGNAYMHAGYFGGPVTAENVRQAIQTSVSYQGKMALEAWITRLFRLSEATTSQPTLEELILWWQKKLMTPEGDRLLKVLKTETQSFCQNLSKYELRDLLCQSKSDVLECKGLHTVLETGGGAEQFLSHVFFMAEQHYQLVADTCIQEVDLRLCHQRGLTAVREQRRTQR